MGTTSPIPRAELAGRLAAGFDRGAVILIAEAGFGKTTAVEEALRDRRDPVVWLPITAADRDPGRLAARLVRRVGAQLPGIAEEPAERARPGLDSRSVSDRRCQITRIADLERIPLEGNEWRPIRRALGITGFGINAYTAAEAGAMVIEPHDETSAGAGGHEELYLVVSGAAEFTVDGETIGAPAGTLVLVPVGVHRTAVATERDTTVLVIGGVPGSVPVSPFEYWYAAQGPYSRGEYEAAIAVASEGLLSYPEHPTLHYQLACFNALAGHREEAIEHLRIAEAGNPQVLEWASSDSDLDPIRDDPGYPR